MYNYSSPFYTRPAFSNSNNIYRENYYNLKNYQRMKKVQNKANTNFEKQINIKKTPLLETQTTSKQDEILFEIFGLKIYFDDVLLICMLLFLYEEGIQDQYLFISLVLLLLS